MAKRKIAKVAAPEVVEEAPTPKPKKAVKAAQTVAEAVKEALAEAIPMAAMAINQLNAKKVDLKQQEINDENYRLKDLKCSECLQLRLACRDKHRKIVVYPRSAKNGQFFQGLFINGVRYLSNHSGHAIVVPENVSVEHEIEKWEANEDALSQGRERQHNSGTISMGGGTAGFNPAAQGWR